MITGLEINSLNKEKIKMYELTKNVVVLFSNSELKNKFRKEFLKITQDETDKDNGDVIYSTIIDKNKVKEQDHKAEITEVITYLPTSIYMVDNEQKFIFTTEAPFVLQCTNPYDLWFCKVNEKNEVELYALTDFEKYEETWNEGVEKIYRMFINGIYGCYKGYGE